MARPPITVLMPVYNTAPYLAACLDSVLAQTFTDFRLLCCDDASTDDSLDILTRYANRDARITVLQNKENQGAAYTYNRLMRSVETKYMAVCDADDLIHRERLAYQYDFMEYEKTIDIVGSWMTRFKNNNPQRGELAPFYSDDHSIKSGLLVTATIANPTVLIRTATLPAGILRDEKRWGRSTAACDYDLFCRLAPHVRFANIPKALFYYRIHDTQMSSAGADFQLQTALEISRQHFARFNINVDTETIRIFRTARLHSPYRITPAQREKLIQLLEHIRNVRNFYDYPGVSSHFIKYMQALLLPYLMGYSRVPVALLPSGNSESRAPAYTRILRNRIVQRLLALKPTQYIAWKMLWSTRVRAFLRRIIGIGQFGVRIRPTDRAVSAGHRRTGTTRTA